MTQTDTIIFIVKLILGGLSAFFAILLWVRTKDFAWMCVVAGVVTKYAGIVYEMLVLLGVISSKQINVLGQSVSTLAFTSLPDLFFIVAFIMMIYRNRR